MMFKTVKYLIPAEDVNMGGIMIKQALPTNNVPQVDPFLLIHHANFKTRSDSPAKHQGIGPHPHRGFSPVTFVVEGEIHHRDSRGHNQIAKKGEVQWMNAGAGIIHSERPSQNIVEKGVHQEIIQIWINSPSASKMKPPQYQFLDSKNKQIFTSEDGLIRNSLITGSYNNLQGNLKGESDLLIIWGEGQTGGIQNIEIPSGFSSMLYLIKGNIQIKGYGPIESKDLLVFGMDDNTIGFTLSEDSQFLILSGEPINEKVVQQGPFVMNTETEILEAMRDYQMGKMGILIED